MLRAQNTFKFPSEQMMTSDQDVTDADVFTQLTITNEQMQLVEKSHNGQSLTSNYIETCASKGLAAG